MAKTLDKFPKTNRPAKYPWKEWFDGRVWQLTKGEDFNTSVVNFRSQAYIAATKHGLKVRVHANGDDAIVLQARSELDP